MRNEFTAVLERDGKWFVAYCPEIPGANGQGKNKQAALKSLSSAIALILKNRREDGLRGLPGLQEEVEVRVRQGAVVITSSAKARSGWSEAAQQLRERGGDRLLDESVTTRFDDREWRWR